MHVPVPAVASRVAVQVTDGETVTVYDEIAAPPLDLGSPHDTTAVVDGSATTWTLRGADGVVGGIVTVVPPEPTGVKGELASLARPGPTPFTARNLTSYDVPLVSPLTVIGEESSAGDSAVQFVPPSREYS